MADGLKDLVNYWVDQFLSGTDLFRLQLQQSMQPSEVDPEVSGQSPSVQVLQQNTRLVVITLEVIRGLQLPTRIELPFPASSSREEDEAEAAKMRPPVVNISFVSGQLKMPIDPLDGDPIKVIDNESELRSAAVRLLISFNGAALGYLRPARCFVETTIFSYVSGWTADDIFLALKDEEFAQSGGLYKIRPHGGTNVSATLFARWLSIIYMTMAQMGIAHPRASESTGWAWVCALESMDDGEGGPLEAHGVADFVSHTLKNSMIKEEAAAAGGGGGGRTFDESHDGFSIRFEDPDLAKTSTFALVLAQQISLVNLTKELVQPRLAAEMAKW